MDMRRFEFAVDRLTIQPLERSPTTKLNVKIRLRLPDDIQRTIILGMAQNFKFIVSDV